MEIVLKKPLERDGKTIGKIQLNFEGLKGSDIIDAEREARMRGEVGSNPLFSSEALAIIAGKSSGLISDDIANLSAPDFMHVTTAVKNFLYEWAL